MESRDAALRAAEAHSRAEQGDLIGAGHVLAAGPALQPGDDAFAVGLGDDVVSEEPRLAAVLFRLAAESVQAAADWAGVAAARQREVAALAACAEREAAFRAARGARQAIDRISDQNDRLVNLSNLAIGLKDAGFIDVALDALGQVVQERRRAVEKGDRGAAIGLCAALVNATSCHIDGGDPREGLALLDDAELRVRDLGDLVRLGNVLVNRAVAYSRLGRPGDARQAYAEAAASYEAGEAGPGDRAYALRGEAATLATVGRWDEAKQRYAAAADLFGAARTGEQTGGRVWSDSGNPAGDELAYLDDERHDPSPFAFGALVDHSAR
jgi:tetratricopeptide (TPR) repeat protein